MQTSRPREKKTRRQRTWVDAREEEINKKNQIDVDCVFDK